jgi:hypothetical protein
MLSFFSKSSKEEAEFEYVKGKVNKEMFRDQQSLRENIVIRRD